MNRFVKKIGKSISTIILIITLLLILAAIVFGRIFSTSIISPEIVTFSLLGVLSLFIVNMYFSLYEKIDKLDEKEKNDSAIVLITSNELYKACALACEEVYEKKNSPFIIRHAALHASLGHERVSKIKSSPIYSEFDNLMKKLISKSGADTWEFRAIFLIPYEQRLNFLIEKMSKKEFEKGQNFSIKIFIPPFPIPYISPFIIKEDEGFIAFDASSEYRVQKGIQIKGKESVKMLIEYFDDIWNNPNGFEIRTVNRLNQEKIEEVKKLLKSKIN